MTTTPVPTAYDDLRKAAEFLSLCSAKLQATTDPNIIRTGQLLGYAANRIVSAAGKLEVSEIGYDGTPK